MPIAASARIPSSAGTNPRSGTTDAESTRVLMVPSSVPCRTGADETGTTVDCYCHLRRVDRKRASCGGLSFIPPAVSSNEAVN